MVHRESIYVDLKRCTYLMIFCSSLFARVSQSHLQVGMTCQLNFAIRAVPGRLIDPSLDDKPKLVFHLDGVVIFDTDSVAVCHSSSICHRTSDL